MCVDLQQWRSHLDQMHQHNDAIKSLTEDSKVCVRGVSECVCVCVYTDLCVHLQSYLSRLQQDLSKALEKVSSREKYISKQLEPLIQEYRSVRARLHQVNRPASTTFSAPDPVH